jgi:hypothetical protein
MVFKWVLLTFAVTAVALFVLGKALAFLHPPRPGRPGPPLLARVERALRWTVLIPFAIAVVLLALALSGHP